MATQSAPLAKFGVSNLVIGSSTEPLSALLRGASVLGELFNDPQQQQRLHAIYASHGARPPRPSPHI